MLTTTAKITDSRLEPTDQTRMVVTIENSNSAAIAKNVNATAALRGACVEGITLTPTELSFGSIPPRGKVVRELSISTERAAVAKYTVGFNLNYESELPAQECDQVQFQVLPD